MVVFERDELERLVYLCVALFESLWLYPPSPIEHKVATDDDVLPSGHTVRAGDTVLVLCWTMSHSVCICISCNRVNLSVHV
jgi:cytochrome P450